MGLEPREVREDELDDDDESFDDDEEDEEEEDDEEEDESFDERSLESLESLPRTDSLTRPSCACAGTERSSASPTRYRAAVVRR